MALKVLLIEDDMDHAEITKRILKLSEEEYDTDLALNGKEGLAKMEEKEYDVILCDYNLPDIMGTEILKTLRARDKDIPFVVATSAGSEKIAVTMMKGGASDYVVKDESYEDVLNLVIKKAIDMHKERKEKEELEEKVKVAAQEWETTFNSITDMIAIYDKELNFIRINKAFGDMFDVSLEDVKGKNFSQIVEGGKRPEVDYEARDIFDSMKPAVVEFFEPKLNFHVELSESPVLDEKNKVAGIVHIIKDIRERKKAEEAVKNAQKKLEEKVEELERFNKLAVGRELRMIELKKENERLLKELKGKEQNNE